MGSPLTGFDWHVYDPHLLVTSSLDTTCTVWDVTGGQRLTQWRAHDQEVLDVSFANQPHAAHLLSSVSADGSLRLFDLR
ncbi:ddb1 and cul4 associated factor 7, partial [Coelomomyces lativittatus]